MAPILKCKRKSSKSYSGGSGGGGGGSFFLGPISWEAQCPPELLAAVGNPGGLFRFGIQYRDLNCKRSLW